jgi:N-hydroxyarylamine O-acetyltransferase
VDVDAYLRRIGIAQRPEPDTASLAALQRAHLLHVPFDALDCLLGNPVSVEPRDAYRKVVEHRRGGFCFELNGLFAWLLGELGFEVRRLAARPLLGDRALAPPLAHLALLVPLERRWLVDVGFGLPFALEPLDVDDRGVQERGGGRFRVARDADGLLAEEAGRGEPRAYRFTLEPVEQAAFTERCRAYSTDPESGFVRRGPVQQAFDDGWVSLTRDTLGGERAGARLDRPITGEADWREQLERHFGLTVDGREVRGTGA